MKRKYLFISGIVLLGLCAGGVLFQYVTSPPDAVEQRQITDNSKTAEVLERLNLPPEAPAEIAALKKQPVSTWEAYRDARIEILLSNLWDNSETPEELEKFRQAVEEQQHEIAERFKAAQIPPPPYPTIHPAKELWQKMYEYEARYHGPQTPEALIAEFDEEYQSYSRDPARFNERFPKAEWLQKLLDKGAHVRDAGDYNWYFAMRRELIKREQKPGMWLSGSHGIPITTDFEEYTDGFIERKLWEGNIIRKISEEHGSGVHVVYFPGTHPDKYLPHIGKITYVNQDPSGAMLSWGAPLTKEQRDDLLYKRIEPEDIEIVYVDEDYNVLSTPPDPFDPIKWREENSYDIVPEGLRAPDGTIVTPERYEELRGEPMPAEMQQRYEAYAATQSSGDEREAMRAAAREAAETARVKFEQGLRELERLMNMSDAQIAAELERRLIPQLPELPTAERLKKALWSEAQSPLMTPARFEAAFRILEQYGPEKGMERLRRADPKLVEQVRHFFGQPPAERPPEKPNTAEPPQPPEAPPAQR